MNFLHQQSWYCQDVAAIESVEGSSGQVVGFSEKSPDKSTLNEDAAGVFVFDDAMILAIADGIGGANCGDRASKAIIDSLSVRLSNTDSSEGLRTGILDAIESSNQEILDWGVGAGATVVVGLFTEDSIRVFHVGDAEGLMCSNRGTVKYSTLAHSPVAMAVEIGVLNERDAMHHEDRNLVTNHVGMQGMRIEIGPKVKMQPHDTFLLGSDGLFDNLMVSEIVELIRRGSLKEKANSVLASTRKRMQGQNTNLPTKPDDLTVLIFKKHCKAESSG